MQNASLNVKVVTGTKMQVLEKSQRTLGNNDLHLKEALVIGSYAGQVYILACSGTLRDTSKTQSVHIMGPQTLNICKYLSGVSKVEMFCSIAVLH